MTLYKADFLDLVGTAVKKEDDKVKKPRTEKQIAATEKMKETRKAKKELELSEKIKEQETIKNLEVAVQEKEKEIENKKALRNEKRRMKNAALPVIQEETPSNTSAEVEVEKEDKPVVSKKRKVKEIESGPPQWFQKYIEGVNKEKNLLQKEKKPAKQIKFESQNVAEKSWNDDITRDRVQQEVDGHMGRMYNMMFGNRRLL